MKRIFTLSIAFCLFFILPGCAQYQYNRAVKYLEKLDYELALKTFKDWESGQNINSSESVKLAKEFMRLYLDESDWLLEEAGKKYKRNDNTYKMYGLEMLGLAEDINSLLSGSIIPASDSIITEAENAARELYSWATFINIIDRSNLSTDESNDLLLSIIKAQEMNLQSYKVLSEFFIDYNNYLFSAAVNKLTAHLDNGFTIADNEQCAAAWLSFFLDSTQAYITKHNANNTIGYTKYNDIFLTASLYQRIFPGSGMGNTGLNFRRAQLSKVLSANMGINADGKILLTYIHDDSVNLANLFNTPDYIYINFMFTCDPKYVPKSIDEVEYVVEVFEYLRPTDDKYTDGSTGAKICVKVRLWKYPEGKIIGESITLVGGDPPDTAWFNASEDGVKYHTGDAPSTYSINPLVEQMMQRAFTLINGG